MSAQDHICFWRDDIDALAFHPKGHAGLCVVHRLAFRALLGHTATPHACRDYFENRQSIFESAALEKIARMGIAAENNFHLNSRDIRRTFTRAPAPARAPTGNK